MKYLPALLLLAGCTAFEPNTTAPIRPTPEYRALWDSAQACTGLHGDFSQLRFFVVPAADMGDLAGHTEGRDIYLREGWEQNTLVVKHEMIHALGIHHHHPYHPFVNPCHATWESAND